MSRKVVLTVSIGLFMLMMASSGIGIARAAQAFVVDSVEDAVDSNPGDGVCATAAGECTLRAAIQEANALAGRDTIRVPKGIITLKLAGAGEDQAASGDLDITDDLTINGSGSNDTVVKGGDLDRVFHIHPSADVFVDMMDIRNGAVQGDGGAVLNQGTLRLMDSNVSHSRAEGKGHGGGIANEGDLTLEYVTVRQSAAFLGGGIYNSGFIRMGDVGVYESTASGEGGGIFNRAVIESSTSLWVIGNVTTGVYGGGGIYNAGNMQVVDGLVMGNHAGWSGGGVFNLGSLEVEGVKFENNAAEGIGGGVYNGGTMGVDKSEFTGNAAQRGAGIGNYLGELTVTETSLHTNKANLDGGGVYNYGTATLDRVTIESNASMSLGGGFLNDGADAEEGEFLSTAQITNSEIRENYAQGAGGGIVNWWGGTLTVEWSIIEANTSAEVGGLVNFSGVTILRHCNVSNNQAEEGGGGAENLFGVMTVESCIIYDNGAAQGGGLINFLGELSVVESSVVGNRAQGAAGGIFNLGTTTVLNATIRGNEALAGGGIYNFGEVDYYAGGEPLQRRLEGLSSDPSLQEAIAERTRVGQEEEIHFVVALEGSTVSGNVAADQGGGVYNADVFNATNSTIAENAAQAGGSLYNSPSGSAEFANTIVADGDCSGSGLVSSLGHNLESGGTCGFNAVGDLTGVDPLLSPLADNGGSTLTHALLIGSPAIDAADNATCGSLDQRGQPRPVDGDGDGDAVCDIGAYEYEGGGQSFVDVDPGHWAFDYIELLFRNGYVAGCDLSPRKYCPEDGMRRAEAAVFVERGVWGAGFIPETPAPPPVFADVPVFEDASQNPWYAKWVTALWYDGYTEGCGVDEATELPRYCPAAVHTRAEAAVFFLRMLKGAAYDGDAARPTAEEIANLPFEYEDVPLPSPKGEPPWEGEPWYSKWVYRALLDGVVGSCEDDANRGDLRFRPGSDLRRAEAACMMVKAKDMIAPAP